MQHAGMFTVDMLACGHTTCKYRASGCLHATLNMQHATWNMEQGTCNMQVQHATCNMQHRHVETWTHGHADMLTRGHVACAEQVFVLASSECKSAFELGFRSLRRIFEVAYGQPFVFKSLCIDHTWAASNDAASMTAVSMRAGLPCASTCARRPLGLPWGTCCLSAYLGTVRYNFRFCQVPY